MLAKRVDDIPHGDGWLFEPKWDGFRTLVFRNGDHLLLQSRDLKPMDRYFPELAAPLLKQLPDRCAIDGELVIADAHGLEFETLQARIHPAASRVAMLAEQTPASLVAWDLLCFGARDLTTAPFRERRALLERLLAVARPPLHVTPLTASPAQAEDWFRRFEGAGLDGVMAKDPESAYQPGKRAMLKVKHRRTADCVVAGLRWHRGAPEERVGSLLLGLFDDERRLHHIGVVGSFTAARRTSAARPPRSRALAPGQGSRRVHLRPARGHRPVRVAAHLRGRVSSPSGGRGRRSLPLPPRRAAILDPAYSGISSQRSILAWMSTSHESGRGSDSAADWTGRIGSALIRSRPWYTNRQPVRADGPAPLSAMITYRYAPVVNR